MTDWTGPPGGSGGCGFSMRSPCSPARRSRIAGTVTSTPVDDTGCGWVEIEFAMLVADEARVTGSARVALPMTPDDNPWERRGDRWRP